MILAKMQKAIKFATKTHNVYQKQKRKGKDISYITHPLTVGLILSRISADEDVICAGILHDTIEDSIPAKKVTYDLLKERFGKKVAQLVLDVTEQDKSKPWEDRKKEARQHIATFSHDSLMLKSADLASNLSELVADYKKEGDSVFLNFKASKNKTISHALKTIGAISKKWPANPPARHRFA
ncbi:MAG: HD domain-containing protein [Patescibacteria group bacterium]